MQSGKRVPNILKIILITAWVVMLGTLLARETLISSLDLNNAAALKRSKEESYVGVFFQKQRIGYVKQNLQDSGHDTFLIKQEGYLQLNILGENHPVHLKLEATLSANLLLRDFVFHLDSPFYVMKAKGKVENSKVIFTIDTVKEKSTDTIKLKSPPFLATQQRTYLLQQGLEAGDKIKVPYFDPVSLSGKESLMEYKGKEKILIRGRIQNLHRFVETISGIRINSWLNDDGRVIKEESPAGFIFLAEPEFLATAVVKKGKEILRSVSIPATGLSTHIPGQPSVSYKIKMPDDPALRITGQRQQWQGNILTVIKEKNINADAPACDEPPEYLASSIFVQADHHEIINLASSLTSQTTGDGESVKILGNWVFNNIEKRPVIGLPDALTTLRNRRGDCNEHAALFTALARSINIPTRMVAGVTLQHDAFYYHAWNEVCVDNRWISIDTTKDQIPADATHIKFVVGEIEEMIRIASLIGNLAIEILWTVPLI